jgi:hypothetical protein
LTRRSSCPPLGFDQCRWSTPSHTSSHSATRSTASGALRCFHHILVVRNTRQDFVRTRTHTFQLCIICSHSSHSLHSSLISLPHTLFSLLPLLADLTPTYSLLTPSSSRRSHSQHSLFSLRSQGTRQRSLTRTCSVATATGEGPSGSPSTT